MPTRVVLNVPQSEEAREDAEALAEERGGELGDVEAALEEMEAQEAEALDLLRNDRDVRHVRKEPTQALLSSILRSAEKEKLWCDVNGQACAYCIRWSTRTPTQRQLSHGPINDCPATADGAPCGDVLQHLEACGALGSGAELLVGLQRLQAARDGARVRAWPAVWCLTLAASVTLSVVRSCS